MNRQPITRIGRTLRAASAAGLLVLTAACATGPTTREEVCEAYDTLGDRAMGLGSLGSVIGNPVFWAAGNLSDIAGRYEGAEDLSADADELDDISDADETDMNELSNATRQVANLCGHPLGLGQSVP